MASNANFLFLRQIFPHFVEKQVKHLKWHPGHLTSKQSHKSIFEPRNFPSPSYTDLLVAFVFFAFDRMFLPFLAALRVIRVDSAIATDLADLVVDVLFLAVAIGLILMLLD